MGGRMGRWPDGPPKRVKATSLTPRVYLEALHTHLAGYLKVNKLIPLNPWSSHT